MDLNLSLPVLSLLTSAWFVRTMAGLSIGLVVAAVVVPRRVPRARDSAAAAAISPLWVLLPTPAGIGLLILFDRGNKALQGWVMLAVALAQLVLTVVVIFRHRRWPWIAAPLALVPVVWWAVLVAAIGLGGMGA
jgi:hypothetical protein